ncbi:MAG TPA: 30S ribosomal protein S7 [Candidatus Paceibacterota bacterium]
MRRTIKRKFSLAPDPTYQDLRVAKLVNYCMERGKKNVARSIVYGAFEDIKTQTKREPLEIFDEAIRNAGPLLEVRSRRIGGANYQVPREVRENRRLSLALRWIIAAAKAKKGKPMRTKLAEEFMAASKNEGEAVKKRENVHKMAEANRAFAHFSW